MIYIDGQPSKHRSVFYAVREVMINWPKPGPERGTYWVDVDRIEDGKVVESQKAPVHPDIPKCSHPAGHAWARPCQVVGGLEENPGVHGHGGGMIVTSVCARCGIYRILDTWATDRLDGTEGLVAIKYLPADECSLEWVDENAREEDWEIVCG